MGKHESNLAVTKTKAVLTGYTGLFQEVIIMKTINIYYMEAVKISKAVKFYKSYEQIDGLASNFAKPFEDTYQAATKIWLENDDDGTNREKFALILPDKREDASELCRALKMYITYESSFWRFNNDLKKGLRGCMIDLCDRILMQY